MVFQYLKDNYKEDGGSLFTRSHMRGQGVTRTSHTTRGFDVRNRTDKNEAFLKMRVKFSSKFLSQLP